MLERNQREAADARLVEADVEADDFLAVGVGVDDFRGVVGALCDAIMGNAIESAKNKSSSTRTCERARGPTDVLDGA